MCEEKTKECIICLEDVPSNKMCSCFGVPKKLFFISNSDAYLVCNHAWSMEFCYETFSKTWMTKAYKNHKKQLLFDIEKSKIPNTMPAVKGVRAKKTEILIKQRI